MSLPPPMPFDRLLKGLLASYYSELHRSLVTSVLKFLWPVTMMSI